MSGLNKLVADNRLTLGLFILASYMVFQTLYFLAARSAHQQYTQTVAQALEKRIALDLPWLRLPNDIMNKVADEQAVQRYLAELNQQAEARQQPVRVLNLAGINAPQILHNRPGIEVTHQMQAPGQMLALTLFHPALPLSQALSVVPLLAALLLGFLIRQRLVAVEEQSQHQHAEHGNNLPKLIIDLRNRTLSNGLDERQIQLSNKPFCFYVALLEYCLHNQNAALNHNKNIPSELLELANRYFSRLMELGHTIRKRPDFSTNLDKMLSEIRAALDDVFRDTPELKAPFYPPKAQGEGSRSKLHNYALEEIRQAELEFIGK